MNSVNKHHILYFVFKLTLFIFILFILDLIIGNTLRFYYFKQINGALYRTTYSIEKTKAEILIFGSSRAEHHYRPDIFEKKYNLSCYNVGRDGSFILYHISILKMVLKRYTPKVIVLDVCNNEFDTMHDSYDKLSSLLPYYKTHPEIHSIIEMRSPFEKYKLISSIYPFNSYVLNIISGNIDYGRRFQKYSDIKGYRSLHNTWNEPLEHIMIDQNMAIDQNKIIAYRSFIEDCIKANVKLYIFISPYFWQYRNTSRSIILANEIAQEYQIPFWNYSQDSLFLTNSKYFSDKEHLNDDGAKIFSGIVSEKIIPLCHGNGNSVTSSIRLER